MPDIEKVINELIEHIESELAMCSEWADGVPVDLLQYAVALLKEQDATIKRQQDVIDIMASEQYDDYPFFNDGKGE